MQQHTTLAWVLLILVLGLGLLSLCPTMPGRLACGGPDAPRSHVVECTATTDLSGASWRVAGDQAFAWSSAFGTVMMQTPSMYATSMARLSIW
jgi:hypothetical protein